MVVGAKVCDLTYGFLWFVCGLYVGILTSSLITVGNNVRYIYFFEYAVHFTNIDFLYNYINFLQ